MGRESREHPAFGGAEGEVSHIPGLIQKKPQNDFKPGCGSKLRCGEII